jgi:hypothetical protein
MVAQIDALPMDRHNAGKGRNRARRRKAASKSNRRNHNAGQPHVVLHSVGVGAKAERCFVLIKVRSDRAVFQRNGSMIFIELFDR